MLPNMAKILAVTNQKGGVGKTTTTVNLSASLAAQNTRVLMVDLDPQANATMSCGIDKHTLTATINEVLLGEIGLQEAIQATSIGLDVVGANSHLTVAEVRLLSMPNREQRLCEALRPVQDAYDFILIDCPPALNILTVNALIAAQSVIIPVQCEYYALEGLTALLRTIEQLRQLNPGLQIEGVLRTMYDGRNRLTLEVSDQLQQHFPNKVYRTVIPRNVKLAEAPSHGLPILQYNKRSLGAKAYLALAAEVLSKQTNREKIDVSESA